jgi:5-methylcytosine-specific restriction endonuclease McrA
MGRKRLTRLEKMNHAFLKLYRQESTIEQKYKCIYCKETFEKLTTEHKVSRKNLGSNEKHNIAASCEPCNKIKSNLNHDEFMKKIQTKKPESKYLLIWAKRRIYERAELAIKRIEKRCK